MPDAPVTRFLVTVPGLNLRDASQVATAMARLQRALDAIWTAVTVELVNVEVTR